MFHPARECAPGLLLDLQAEPLGHALLDAAYQDGGGVGAGHVDRLVGGEQRDACEGELFFQLQGIVGVAAGSFDVFAWSASSSVSSRRSSTGPT
jgi:hypothetical protein